jgi:hypothetical protein
VLQCVPRAASREIRKRLLDIYSEAHSRPPATKAQPSTGLREGGVQ